MDKGRVIENLRLKIESLAEENEKLLNATKSSLEMVPFPKSSLSRSSLEPLLKVREQNDRVITKSTQIIALCYSNRIVGIQHMHSPINKSGMLSCS